MILTDYEKNQAVEHLTMSQFANKVDYQMAQFDAIEAAVIKRLAGVGVEPVVTVDATMSEIIPARTRLYTETALAAARVQSLEEAEAAVRKAIGDCDLGWAAQKAIRALIGAGG